MDPFFDLDNRVTEFMGEFADAYDIPASTERLRTALTTALDGIDPHDPASDYHGIQDHIWQEAAWLVEKA